MNEYKTSFETPKLEIKENYSPNFENSLNYIKGLIQKEEPLNEYEINLLKISLKDFNVCYKAHPGKLIDDYIEEFSIPYIFFDIYKRFPLQEERDLFLGSLTSFDCLASDGILSFQQLYDAEITQDFVQILLNYKKDREGNDTITLFTYICSIIDNIITQNNPDSAKDFISIGLSNALNEFISNIALLTPDEASANYLELLGKTILRLRTNLYSYGLDVEEFVEFIMRVIDSENDFLIEQMFKSVFAMISKKSLNIGQLFENEKFIHLLCENAFNKKNISAINLLCEYLLYDEIVPELHDAIIALSQDVDYSSLFDTIKTILTKNEENNRDIIAPLISLIGNFFHKCEILPDDFNPDDMTEIFNILYENGSLDEKFSISFLLIEVWLHLPIEILNCIIDEKTINFVLDNASLKYSQLTYFALDFLKYYFEEITKKSMSVEIFLSITQFLDDLQEADEDLSDKADYLISTYNLSNSS